MTWALAIGGGTALVAAIYLAIKVVSLSREFAVKLGDVHVATDRTLSAARSEIAEANRSRIAAEHDREELRRNCNAMALSLEAARMHLAKEQRINAGTRERMVELQRIIDETSTPSSVRERLRRLLSPG